MPVTLKLDCQPGLSVMVAGFQNIDDTPPPPAAAPAKAMPIGTAPCSCSAKAPAWAAPDAAKSATLATPDVKIRRAAKVIVFSGRCYLLQTVPATDATLYSAVFSALPASAATAMGLAQKWPGTAEFNIGNDKRGKLGRILWKIMQNNWNWQAFKAKLFISEPQGRLQIRTFSAAICP